MRGELKSLTYVSRAARGLSDADLCAIKEVSLALNAITAITGLLIYDGQSFMQIIEGAGPALSALLQRLMQDKRHHDLTIVDERTIGERSFGDWSMKLVRADPGQDVRLEEIEDELGPDLQPEIRAMLVGTITMMGALT